MIGRRRFDGVTHEIHNKTELPTYYIGSYTPIVVGKLNYELIRFSSNAEHSNLSENKGLGHVRMCLSRIFVFISCQGIGGEGVQFIRAVSHKSLECSQSFVNKLL